MTSRLRRAERECQAETMAAHRRTHESERLPLADKEAGP